MPIKLWCKGLLVTAVLTMLLSFSGYAAARAEGEPTPAAAGKPEAYWPQTTYEFEPLMEGTDITHDFIVENRGQAPLAIHKVQPD